MTAKVLVLYNTPADQDAFDRHYRSTHIPIAKRLPGLRSYTVSKGPVRAAQGESPFSFIAELTFDSVDDMRKALSSPEMQEAGADLQNFAGAGVTVLRFDTEEV